MSKSIRENPEYKQLIPRATEEEYEALKESMRIEGQHLPIIINSDSEILDGYTRYKICSELNIEPKTIVKDFPSKLLEKKFVIESNLKRRHLNNYQKAKLGYALEPIERELASERRSTHKTKGSNETFGKTTEIVASQIGISRSTYERARKIIEAPVPDIQQKVESGELTINKAYNIIGSWEDQSKLDKYIDRATKQEQKLIDAIEQFNNFDRAEDMVRDLHRTYNELGKWIEVLGDKGLYKASDRLSKDTFPLLNLIGNLLYDNPNKSRFEKVRIELNLPKGKSRSERMYKDTKTWNPYVGCNYQCSYCKPSFQKLVAWIGKMHNCTDCQAYKPHEHYERLARIPNERIIFVCGDGDITFCRKEFMEKILLSMRRDKKKGRLWFIQSKNPSCFKKYLSLLPENTYLLTTLETNRDEGYSKISKAPVPSVRCRDFKALKWDKKIVTVEPIMDFDLKQFAKMLISIKPKAVFIGYNSHPTSVPISEPTWEKLLALWRLLRRNGIKVLPKETRRKYILKRAYREFEEES